MHSVHASQRMRMHTGHVCTGHTRDMHVQGHIHREHVCTLGHGICVPPSTDAHRTHKHAEHGMHAHMEPHTSARVHRSMHRRTRGPGALWPAVPACSCLQQMSRKSGWTRSASQLPSWKPSRWPGSFSSNAVHKALLAGLKESGNCTVDPSTRCFSSLFSTCRRPWP